MGAKDFKRDISKSSAAAASSTKASSDAIQPKSQINDDDTKSMKTLVTHCQQKNIPEAEINEFKVGEIKQTVDNKRLWEVQLSITNDDDPQLAILTDRIKEEVQGSNGWFRMGKLMIKVGHFNQAEAFHNELLKNASSDIERAYIYHQLGRVKDNQGKYQEAVAFHEKSIEVREKSLPPNHPDLAESYNNIGMVYNHMSDYVKALKFHEKSMQIRKISLPPNHFDLAESYNSIGLLYNTMGDYSKAIPLLEKALAIFQNSLPPTHPNIKVMMHNIQVAKNNL
ncbi:unnamed protein product [Adineta steineri]|uniref:Kinesin light chain n=1 Tax=Adineta steineri TaxID=433720 RepID=A0A819L3K8_9BILA|nr:unnamed protein product [Adineta steineri]